MSELHEYKLMVQWSGNTGHGTKSYTGYSRNHTVLSHGKEPMTMSSDSAFRGDVSCYNPEEMLLYSASACHMLWYLHLCTVHHVVVHSYTDEPIATMEELPSGAGAFTSITLQPSVAISSGDPQVAEQIHKDAHKYCFIANSLRVPITVQPTISSM